MDVILLHTRGGSGQYCGSEGAYEAIEERTEQYVLGVIKICHVSRLILRELFRSSVCCFTSHVTSRNVLTESSPPISEPLVELTQE